MRLETDVVNPETSSVHWNKVTVVGVGLLGGSLGLALRQRGLANSVAGYVRRAASIVECEKAGAVTYATRDLAKAVNGADLIVLCTPLGQMRQLIEQMAGSIKPGAIVTDVGSVKGIVVDSLEKQVAKAGGHFIGSHPMAGAEKTGVSAARADLFVEAVCVITPTAKSNRAAIKQVESLWKAIGARVLKLAPKIHDQFVSRSSHLPHMVAATLANLVLHPGHPKEQTMLCANGFRDTTRIASGSPEMWRDIALTNRKYISQALLAFSRQLQKLHKLISAGDSRGIERFLTETKLLRDGWQQTGATSRNDE